MSIANRLRRSAALSAILCAALLATTASVALAATDPLAQERYYSSYGEPEPLTLPQSPAPSNDTPWLPIALSITGALVITAASATQLRRLRLRRRRAARSTA